MNISITSYVGCDSQKTDLTIYVRLFYKLFVTILQNFIDLGAGVMLLMPKMMQPLMEGHAPALEVARFPEAKNTNQQSELIVRLYEYSV